MGAVAISLSNHITAGYSVPYTRTLPEQIVILDEAIGKIATGQAHLLDDKERSLLELEPDPEDPQNKVRLKSDVMGEAARYRIQYRNAAEIDFLTNAHGEAAKNLRARFPQSEDFSNIDREAFEGSNEIARAVLALQTDVVNLASLFSRQRSR